MSAQSTRPEQTARHTPSPHLNRLHRSATELYLIGPQAPSVNAGPEECTPTLPDIVDCEIEWETIALTERHTELKLFPPIFFTFFWDLLGKSVC